MIFFKIPPQLKVVPCLEYLKVNDCSPKKEKAKGEALSVGTQPAPDINSGSATTTSAEVIPVRDLQYDIIHGEDGDLWNIIHKRYMQYYEKLGAE